MKTVFVGIGPQSTLPDTGNWLALLREDRYPRVYDLKDMIAANSEAVVGGVSQRRSSMRTFKSNSKPVEAFDERRSASSALQLLLNGSSPGGLVMTGGTIAPEGAGGC